MKVKAFFLGLALLLASNTAYAGEQCKFDIRVQSSFNPLFGVYQRTISVQQLSIQFFCDYLMGAIRQYLDDSGQLPIGTYCFIATFPSVEGGPAEVQYALNPGSCSGVAPVKPVQLPALDATQLDIERIPGAEMDADDREETRHSVK